MKVIDYEILFVAQPENSYDLENKVVEAIKEGWEPQGGLCFRPGTQLLPPIMYQAMIKWENI